MTKFKTLVALVGLSILTGCTTSTLIVKDVDVSTKRKQAESAVASYGLSIPDGDKKLRTYNPNGKGLGYIDYETRNQTPAPTNLCKHRYLGTESFLVRGSHTPILKLLGNNVSFFETQDQLQFANPGLPVAAEFNMLIMEVFYYNDLGEEEKKIEALNKLKSFLIKIKDENYFSELIPDGPVYGYQEVFGNLRETLVLIIQGFAIARDGHILSATEDKQIHDWVEKLVASTVMLGNEGANSQGALVPGIHVELQKGLVFALWGSVANDKLYYQAGIKSFMVGLSQSRSDGSHQFEIRDIRDSSERSSNGLKLQAQVVGYMSIIAEIAKNNGQDLYELKTYNGASLATMQNFLAYASLNDIDLPHIKSVKMQRYFLLSKDNDAKSLAWYVPVYKKTKVNIFGEYFNTNINYASLGLGGSLNCFIR